MRRHNKGCGKQKYFFCVLLMMSMLVCLEATADEALLDYVMIKQEEARAALPAFSMTVTTEISSSIRSSDQLLYDRSFKGTSTRIEKGSAMFLSRIGQTATHGEVAPMGPVPNAASSSGDYLEQHFMVQNHGYVASYTMHNDTNVSDLAIRQYTSIDEITREAEGSKEVAVGRSDLLGHAYGIKGFGGDKSSIRNTVRGISGPEMEWNAERKPGTEGEVIVVTLRNSKIGGDPALHATIDPSKGFITTSVEYNPPPIDGQPTRKYRYSVGAKEVKPGIWFPIELQLSDSKPRKNEIHVSSVKNIVTALEIDPQIPDETFSWQALGYPGGKVFVHDPQGKVEVCDLVNGNLVPDPRFSDEVDHRRDAIKALNKMLKLPEDQKDLANHHVYNYKVQAKKKGEMQETIFQQASSDVDYARPLVVSGVPNKVAVKPIRPKTNEFAMTSQSFTIQLIVLGIVILVLTSAGLIYYRSRVSRGTQK